MRYWANKKVSEVELWGILNGLTLIQIMSYFDLRIQSDSVKVIKIIQDSSLTSSNSVFTRHIHHLSVNSRY
ncbi:hypothetical protein J1N35_032369 [Gossypium stocksii]|uniref:RNase H type-1 domain-containing protein n=1 Tax=Gossypium stocksii TaxID=47602 RepID=A0A9D3V3G7_9ROSI|nr:hypothetical protein J1N35_032369 [Gossypium stocksii]